MPPKRACTIQFLRDILAGRKKYFRNSDVPEVYVHRMEKVNVSTVLDKVYDNPEVRCYLPDYEEAPEKRMPRQFLFQIVNKLDP